MRGWILALSSTCLVACGTQGFQTQSPSKTQNPESGYGAQPIETDPGSDFVALPLIEKYQERYKLDDTHTKLVDNQGNGFEKLYGTRNMRAILNGVVYRGGANNRYNKYGKRDNRNPLPTLGLNNLCKEGFSNAVYLYSTNFDSAPKSVSCDSINGAGTKLTYAQNSPYNSTGIKAIFSKVMATIKDPKVGPTYLHCWNGWHASGLISALILRQFCDYSAKDAVAYWDLNTDGNNTDPNFASIRKTITNFTPYAEFRISRDIQDAICAKP